jgi:hypothetical protein
MANSKAISLGPLQDWTRLFRTKPHSIRDITNLCVSTCSGNMLSTSVQDYTVDIQA